jgi:RHS repeat-associated protein
VLVDCAVGCFVDGGTWGLAVTGNVSVLGTAPTLAGTAGASLIGDSIGYALAGGGTGLYRRRPASPAYTAPAATMTAASYDGSGLRATATAGTSQAFTWNTTGQLPVPLTDSTSAYIYSSGLAPAEQVNLTTWGNPQTTGGLTTATPFGYAGGYTDPTGLLYLLNRYYDPATGQFISVEPAVAQTNQPYAYAGGDPVASSDPSGLPHITFDDDRAQVWFNLVETKLIARYGKGVQCLRLH